MPSTSDGEIHQEQVLVNEKEWTVHAVGGTPAQAVLHGVLDIMPHKPDLVVSGINYGLNVGSGVTVSGTVGAALEASAAGIPSLAMSLEVDRSDHFSYSTDVDFLAAAYFTGLFSKILLSENMPDDVYVLKVEVPASATIETPWKTSRLSPVRFYEPIPSRISAEMGQKGIGYDVSEIWKDSEPGTDIYDVLVEGLVAVTPLSLDLTSRINLEELERLRNAE
jgi:5'-nucleotidase